MQGLWDFLDNYVYGPFNYIDRIEGLFKAAKYHDIGYRFTIPRHDKGGKYSLYQVEELLTSYGVTIFCRTFDAENHCFRVKNRQAEWAEYLMLQKGVELHGPLINERNAKYAAHAPTEWMPQPWSAKNKVAKKIDEDDDKSNTRPSISNSLLNKLQNLIDWD